MRIIQINATNGIGSTGNIALSIHNKLLVDGEESYVLWGTRCANPSNSNFIKIGNIIDHKIHAILSRIDKRQGFHSDIATRKACKKILELKPDVVHLHNLHSNYINIGMLLGFLKANNIPVVITLHDCWFFTGSCYYYQKHNDCLQWKTGCLNCPAVSPRHKKSVQKMFIEKKKIFFDWDDVYVVGVSKWTIDDASQSLLSNAKVRTHIYNWVENDDFELEKSRKEICERYGFDFNKKIILGVAQGWGVGNSKGANEFIEISKRYNSIAEVVLVGMNNGMPELPGLHCIGYTSSKKELMELYSIADVFVNPSKFETFGLVNAEAMSCGTAVIAYENTSAKELINDKCGVLIPNGDFEKFVNATGSFVTTNKAFNSEEIKEYVKSNFNKENQLNKYVELYRLIVNDVKLKKGKK